MTTTRLENTVTEAYGQGVLESLIASFLAQAGVINPQVMHIDSRLSEPPMFQIFKIRRIGLARSFIRPRSRRS